MPPPRPRVTRSAPHVCTTCHDGQPPSRVSQVHERHVSTDVLLGLMRSLVLRRPSLRLVLMSATLDAAALSAYFAGAPLVRVPGRAYAVETIYMSANSGAESAGGPAEPADGAGNARARRLMLPSRAKELLGPRLTLRVLQRIDEKYSPRERGDALIFVSGVEEIERLMEVICPRTTHALAASAAPQDLTT